MAPPGSWTHLSCPPSQYAVLALPMTFHTIPRKARSLDSLPLDLGYPGSPSHHASSWRTVEEGGGQQTQGQPQLHLFLLCGAGGEPEAAFPSSSSVEQLCGLVCLGTFHVSSKPPGTRANPNPFPRASVPPVTGEGEHNSHIELLEDLGAHGTHPALPVLGADIQTTPPLWVSVRAGRPP